MVLVVKAVHDHCSSRNYAHLGTSATPPSDLFSFPYIYFLLINLCLWDADHNCMLYLDAGKARISIAAK